ncbi:hypothetical protein LG296_19605 (plasmid) [Ureibacillus chungkukjangi]|uniref:hypothetical protein n=1 Tax=Ureibacillus chungkukjangi TaxID=1202712 RepID=UPI00384F6B53
MNEQQLTMIHNFNLSREDGSYSLWDHPNFKARKVLPLKNYRPILKLTEAIEEVERWSETIYMERMILLKVIGDAVCANENQLRRYMSSKFSPSTTSNHIKALRERGFVERHKCELEFVNDENGDPVQLKNPAPITLGIAGWLILNHYYSGMFLAKPETWYDGNDSSGSSIQRYVAMNEIRCSSVEQNLAKGWNWYPAIGGNSGYKKPFAMMVIGEDTEEYDGRAYMLFERAQLKQNFIGYFRTRLELYRELFERDGCIQVNGVANDAYKIVVLSVSSVKMANLVHEEIGLHRYPFDVFVIVDEWFDTGEKSITVAFAQPSSKDKKELQRIR